MLSVPFVACSCLASRPMYEKFQEVDGRHPWRDVSPDGYVDYQARYRPHGRVLFFNFPLAKEMGLDPAGPSVKHQQRSRTGNPQHVLASDHQRIRSPDRAGSFRLKRSSLTRSWRRDISKLSIAIKQGKTSGDGRSIWNGYLKSENLIFDISSRGTGATILEPRRAGSRRLRCDW